MNSEWRLSYMLRIFIRSHCRAWKGFGLLAIAGLFMLLLCACQRGVPYLERLRQVPADRHICKVAVLPFESESDYPHADTVFHKVFLAALNEAGNYEVVQEGDVTKLYQEFHILPGQTPSIEQLQLLVDRLDVQLLFTGKVMEMRENKMEHWEINPVLAVEIQILDGRTLNILRSIYHRRQGVDYQKVMHFGKITSIAGLSEQAALEIVKLISKEGLSQCNVSHQP